MQASINEDSHTSNDIIYEMEDLDDNDEDSRKHTAKPVDLTSAIEMTDVYKRYRQNCVSVLNGLDLKKCHSQKM